MSFVRSGLLALCLASVFSTSAIASAISAAIVSGPSTLMFQFTGDCIDCIDPQTESGTALGQFYVSTYSRGDATTPGTAYGTFVYSSPWISFTDFNSSLLLDSAFFMTRSGDPYIDGTLQFVEISGNAQITSFPLPGNTQPSGPNSYLFTSFPGGGSWTLVVGGVQADFGSGGAWINASGAPPTSNTPEPATWGTLSGAVGALALLRKRRQV